jgi:carboxyl-terminal processing protease
MKTILKNLQYSLAIFILLILSPQILRAQTDFVTAFNNLHNTLSTRYAFTEWKGVNWDSLYEEYQPQIADAQATNDSTFFYLNIKKYLCSIPDGHISLQGWVDKSMALMFEQIGGSYGLALIKLDNGKIVTRLVTENSPAAQAGIEFGAEIISFNNIPINEALENTSVLWADPTPATTEGKLLNQMRFIGRASVGDTANIEYINPGKSVTETVQLTAVEDNFETLTLTSLGCSTDDTNKVHYSILNPSGYGYLQLTSCGEESTTLPIYYEFHNAMQYFIENNVPGLILDLRINDGGDDWLAAAAVSFFYPDTTLYECISGYDSLSNQFQIFNDYIPHINSQTMELYTNENYPTGALFLEPPELHFTKPVVIMNSTRQISSGEGVAMALQKLSNCEVVSLYGSQGSFGIIQDDKSIWVFGNPNPLIVGYPSGRSLDADQNIQVDSDQNMLGGVIPDIRPILDEAAIDKIFVQGIDYELECAIDRLNTIVSVESNDNHSPEKFTLFQNYPNPFNPMTTIKYSVPSLVNSNSSLVQINVYDILGRRVKTLINKQQSPGNYSVKFDASNLPSGIYFYKLQSGDFVQTRKMILMK